MRVSLQSSVGLALAIFAQNAVAKSVFAHYMIGYVDPSTDHAKQDIESAQAMGFDGFALNVREPTADYATSCIDQVFAAAAGTGFKLFFSLDMNGNTDATPFRSLFSHFEDEAYLKMGDDQPFVSTFWGGALGQDAWSSLKQEYNMYFVPSFDDVEGYYEDPQGFFDQWGTVVDGAFNWETAWPWGGDAPTNVSSDADADFHEAAIALEKDFMMAMSPLQYKHCCGGHYYRIGEGNLPERMTQILDLAPELVEFITWNDAGESHYIGHVWEESFGSAPEILEYANTDEFPHYAWQPLITSFINAYKEGLDASQMTPPADSPIGAMWYRGTLKSCSSEAPAQASSALDAVNWAFVLPAALEGATIRTTSGGVVIGETTAVAGLNYGTVGEMSTGAQKVEIVSGGSVIGTASGTVDVQAELPEFCNFNYYVVGLQ